MKEKRSRDPQKMFTSLSDLVSMCESYKPTSSEVSQKVSDLRKRYNLPGYYWHEVDGYMRATRQRWDRNNLIFCYVINGEIVHSKWNDMTEVQRQFCRDNKNEIGGIWWKDKDGKPAIGHPYHVSQNVTTEEEVKDVDPNRVSRHSRTNAPMFITLTDDFKKKS